MDLAPQEERVVVAHLESCESCHKFHHQLQQVILAAEEVPLPDEMLPQKEGELARLIQQQLPQAKTSPFAFLEDFLGKFTGKKAAAPQQNESAFPHRSNPGLSGGGDNARKKGASAENEDMNAMGSRLKQMKSNFGEAEGFPGNQPNFESREAQSQTRSLGEKFGVALPSEAGEEHGLTLAESIRRKISETTKPPSDDDEPMQTPPMGSQDGWQGNSQPGFAPPPGGNFANPNQYQGTPSSGGFAPPPQNFQGAPGAFAAPPQGFAAPPQSFAGAPQGAPQGAFQGAPPQGAPGFGASPFDNAAQAGQPPMGWAAPAQDGGQGWGAPPANGGVAPVAPAQDQGNWGQAAWDTPQGKAAAPVAAEWSGQSNAPAAWGAPADNASNWTTPTAVNVPQPQSMQQGGGNPGWGAPAPAVAPADAASAAAWGGAQPVQTSAPSDSWSGASNQPAPAAAFAGGQPSDGWGGNNAVAAPAANVGGNGWGAPNPTQPAWGQPGGSDWNSQQNAQQAPVAPPAPASNGWAQPAPSAAPGAAAWGQPTDANSWGGPQSPGGNGLDAQKSELKRAPAPNPAFDLKAELVETGTWKAFAPAEPLGPRSAPTQPKMDVPAPQGAPVNDRWDIPISERMKMQDSGGAPLATAPPAQPVAYAPPAMPTPQPSPQAPPAAGWDHPPQQQQSQPNSAPEGGQTKSGWDFPVYESNDVLTGPGWGAPPTPAVAPEPSNSGMDQLGAAIGDVARGQQPYPQPPEQTMQQAMQQPVVQTQAAAQSPNSWDLSIQERQQLQQQQLAQQTQQQPAGSAWGLPPAAGDGNSWGAPTNAAWGAPTAAPQAVPEPVAPPPVPASPADGRQKLFAPIDDNAIDKLFSDQLGVTDAAPPTQQSPQPPAFQDPSRAAANWEQQQQAAPAQQWGAPGFAPGGQPEPPQAASPAPVPPPPAPAAPAAQTPPVKQGLFNLGDDDMDKLFGDHLGVTEPSKALNAPPAEHAIQAQGQQGESTWNNLEPQPQQQLTNPGWEQPPQQPAAPTWGVPGSAAPAPQSPQQTGSWGEPPAPSADPSGWAAPSMTPAPAAAAAPAQPAWPAPDAAPAWGQPPAAPVAVPPVHQPAANPFASMANAGYGVAPAQPPAQAQVPPSAPAAGQPPATGPQISAVQSAGPGVSSAPQKPANAGLFSIDDSVIDKIFSDNLGVNEGQSKGTAGEDPNANVAPPQKIEGVGRLDSRVDHNQDAGTGRISSIGKFLLDQKDMEKLSKLNTADLSDSSMRILTQEAAGELTTLLHHIAAQNAAVVGSVIVGHDGLLIANTMPPEIEAESAGVWALGVYMNTAHVVKKMGQNRVHQIVSKTPKGYLVIADFGGGLLVVLSDGKDTDTLIPLMRSITQLVVQ